MRKFLFSFLLLLSTAMGFAQNKQPSSLLWEISGKNLQQPSYLFGTIHLICKEDFIFTDTIKALFKNAQEIFLEIDLDDPKVSMKMMQLAQMPKGETLKKYFTEEEFKRVDSFCNLILHSPATSFASFKPLMMISALAQKLADCSQTESYELTLTKMAKELKKDIQGLEKVEDQMAVFDSIPIQEQISFILKMIDDFEGQKKDFKTMQSNYKAQDIQKLYRSIAESSDMMGNEEILLNKRNRNWIPVMREHMQKGMCFFAVGAGHLGGDVGVINLLKKAGYIVKPVSMN